MQGTGPRMALLDEFRETPNCVLFATSSFWQGVDVPGEQLSCVIIDKLPFAVPSDPGGGSAHPQCARGRRQSFYDYQIPQAAIALKQGFGRLIRTGRTAECWRCWITGLRSNATARFFSTACRTTRFPCSSPTWRNFSMFEVSMEHTFAAGHALRNYKGKCENVHGHNYRVQVGFCGGEEADANGGRSPGSSISKRSWRPSTC
jgi:hypothetical protein